MINREDVAISLLALERQLELLERLAAVIRTEEVGATYGEVSLSRRGASHADSQRLGGRQGDPLEQHPRLARARNAHAIPAAPAIQASNQGVVGNAGENVTVAPGAFHVDHERLYRVGVVADAPLASPGMHRSTARPLMAATSGPRGVAVR